MSERVINDPTVAGWEFNSDTGYWMWAGESGISGGGGLWTDNGNGSISYTSGDVGIGTDNPEQLLHVNSDSDWARMSLNGAGDGSLDIKHYDNTAGNGAILEMVGGGDLRMFIGGSESMRIAADGKVGIGTSNPQAPLHISGEDTSTQVIIGGKIGDPDRGLRIATGTGGYTNEIVILDAQNPEQGYIHLQTSSVTRLGIDPTGRVDITGSLYVNGSPKIGTIELIDTLSTLRAATQDETTLEGLRDSISNAIGGLIEKFEAMQSPATQEIEQ